MIAGLKPAIPRFNRCKLRREVMSKPLLGLILGAALGFLDGLGAFFYPGVASMMMGIIIGSTLKGLLTGLVTGFVARKLHSLPLGILTGLSVGLVSKLLGSGQLTRSPRAILLFRDHATRKCSRRCCRFCNSKIWKAIQTTCRVLGVAFQNHS